MNRLTYLRKRLSRLRARRQRLRLGMAFGAVALAVLWILAVMFLFDWLLEMTRLQRTVMLVVGAILVIWAFRRYALPWLGKHESELEMALFVERQQHIDTDIVAAVQFESPEAPEWGSVQLEEAVVTTVAERGKRLNVYEGFSMGPMWRRGALLVVTLALWVLVGIVFHQHVITFLRRVALFSTHYPTRTVIESIMVNGREVDPEHKDGDREVDPSRTVIRTQFGEPIKFVVRCSGELPDRGTVRLRAKRSGVRAVVDLAANSESQGRYVGEFPRLVESARYQLYLGDAWTEPGELLVTKLPAVDIALEVFAPGYARRADESEPLLTGLRQISVLEGSRVVLHLTSDKRLHEAVFAVKQPEEGGEFQLRRPEDNAAGDGLDRWILDQPDTPLDAVVEPIRYTVQVTDEDDQHLLQPIEGVIRLQADFAPRIAAAAVTRLVLPTARPTIYYRAMDDHGLAAISIYHETVHPDGSVDEGETPVYQLPDDKAPERNLEAEYVFQLESLKLRKGDVVQVTMRARDFRGPREGRVASAEAITLEVTDEPGILAGMMEADRHSARELKTMINRQLGVGDLPYQPEESPNPNDQ
ncbi:MAG: hypothetical protein H8E44_06275 [Planctomycetes bacterium]|nr:hypothetical protein [Planctomycetota bacterium]